MSGDTPWPSGAGATKLQGCVTIPALATGAEEAWDPVC